MKQNLTTFYIYIYISFLHSYMNFASPLDPPLDGAGYLPENYLSVRLHTCPASVEPLFVVCQIYESIIDLSFFYKGSIIHLIDYSTNPVYHSLFDYRVTASVT